MLKTRQRETARMILTIAALWAALAYPLLCRSLSGLDLTSLWRSGQDGASSAITAAPPAERQAAAARADADRATVLELVRAYRLGADDAWRRQLADVVYEEAVAASMDPLMVASIVARESSFQSRVVSRAGAVGLMQLRPFVAREVAQRSALEWNGVETLHAPQHNVRLGIIYYKELLDRFEGDPEMALTAYLYGPTRVRRQIAGGTYRGSSYADGILDLYSTLSTRRAGA